MRNTRRLRLALLLAGLHAVAITIAGFRSTSGSPAALALRPIIHDRDEDRYGAMISAPVIIVAQLAKLRVVSYAPAVPKPPIAGPAALTIPMYLVQVSAKVLATLRGDEREAVEFYYWAYALGKHGGSRLFDPSPGTGHVLFLREDAGFLRMVGDYPAYDLEITRAFLSEFGAETDTDRDLIERIVAAQIRAELKAFTTTEEHYRGLQLGEWMGLTSPFFVASTLDSYCRSFANMAGQIAACMKTAEFPGRCDAYRLAKELGSPEPRIGLWLDACKAEIPSILERLRNDEWRVFDGPWSSTPERHRLEMRLLASATDARFHEAACEAAATMQYARDIPECLTPMQVLPNR